MIHKWHDIRQHIYLQRIIPSIESDLYRQHHKQLWVRIHVSNIWNNLSQSYVRNVMTPAELTYLAVFWFSWTTVTQKSRLQCDFHYVSAGGAAVNELVIVWNLYNDIMSTLSNMGYEVHYTFRGIQNKRMLCLILWRSCVPTCSQDD